MITKEEAVHYLERSIRETVWTAPSSIVFSDSEILQVVTPTHPTVSLNGIYHSSFLGNTSEVEIKIDQAVERYISKKLPFRWVLGPNSMPANLIQLLLNIGLKVSYDAMGFIGNPSELTKPISEDIKIEPMSQENLEAAIEVGAKAWGMPDEQKKIFGADLQRSINDKTSRHLTFLAYYKGVPAGTGVLFVCGDYGYLKGAGIIPDLRGKGIYKALVHHRLNVLSQKDINVVTTHGMVETSAPILRKMGFRETCIFSTLHSS